VTVYGRLYRGVCQHCPSSRDSLSRFWCPVLGGNRDAQQRRPSLRRVNPQVHNAVSRSHRDAQRRRPSLRPGSPGLVAVPPGRIAARTRRRPSSRRLHVASGLPSIHVSRRPTAPPFIEAMARRMAPGSTARSRRPTVPPFIEANRTGSPTPPGWRMASPTVSPFIEVWVPRPTCCRSECHRDAWRRRPSSRPGDHHRARRDLSGSRR
jgi:hypothetical protein